jgi:hypothetical protein
MTKAKSLEETFKHHPVKGTQLPKSGLVRIGGIKAKPKTVAPSKRIGGRTGGSA